MNLCYLSLGLFIVHEMGTVTLMHNTMVDGLGWCTIQMDTLAILKLF